MNSIKPSRVFQLLVYRALHKKQILASSTTRPRPPLRNGKAVNDPVLMLPRKLRTENTDRASLSDFLNSYPLQSILFGECLHLVLAHNFVNSFSLCSDIAPASCDLSLPTLQHRIYSLAQVHPMQQRTRQGESAFRFRQPSDLMGL